MDEVLKFIGQLVAYGGGSVAIAYLAFQFLGKSWIEAKFAERLEQLRHDQALELQRLRVEIDSMLSGALKIQEKEFQTLPEVWTLLDKAFGQLSSLVSPFQEYPDLDRYTAPEVEEFLTGTKLSNSQRDQIRHTQQKTKTFQELIFYYRLNDVQKAISEFHNYVARNSMFLPPEIKANLEETSNKLWDAMTSKKIGHEAKDWKIQDEGWKKIKEEVEPMKKKIEEQIYLRLQDHGNRRH